MRTALYIRHVGYAGLSIPFSGADYRVDRHLKEASGGAE